MTAITPEFSTSIRSKTIDYLGENGLEIPSHLPLVDCDVSTRNTEEVVERLLALNVVVARAFGFSKSKILDWLSNFGSRNWLSQKEQEFLLKDEPTS